MDRTNHVIHRIPSSLSLLLVAVLTLMGCQKESECKSGGEKKLTRKERVAAFTSTRTGRTVARAPGRTKKRATHLPPITRPAVAAPLYIKGASLYTGTGGAAIVDSVVVIKKGVVVYAGPGAGAPKPDGARVVDVAGKFIVPGLIDAHIHFFQSGGIYTRPDIVDLRSVRSYKAEYDRTREQLPDTFRRILAAGVTSVVDAGGPMWNFKVRERARKSIAAPGVAVAGPLISTVERPQFDPSDLPIRKVSTPDEAAALVKLQLAHKPDLIKVWFIVPAQGDLKAPLAILERVIKESHGAKTRVLVHVTQLKAAKEAVALGADILAHSIDDAPVDAALIGAMKSKGTILIPTLAVYGGYGQLFRFAPAPSPLDIEIGDPELLREWREFRGATGGRVKQGAARLNAFSRKAPIMAANLKRLHDGGVIIAAGTDSGNMGTLHGSSLHHELALMVKAGLTPEQALLAATRDAAKVFSAKPGVGQLVPGMAGDLIVLHKDPLKDIKNLAARRFIVKGGHLFTPRELVPASPEYLAQRQLDAYNARDLPRFLANYAKDVEVHDFVTGRLLMSGKEHMKRRYAKLFEASPDLKCRLLNRIVAGNVVVDKELVTGMRGSSKAQRATAVYEIESGLIRKVHFIRE